LSQQSQLPFSEKLSKPPRKPKNLDLRAREYLLSDEVEAMMRAAAKVGRHGSRDRALILLMYRHGLRVSETSSLRWNQVDLKRGHLHVHRRKQGKPSTHPLYGDELRVLRQLRRDYPNMPYVFVSERSTLNGTKKSEKAYQLSSL
jgi:type 1 fimbriae regulatory protein FimB/type 1 fimbriae regulatory protein FimE